MGSRTYVDVHSLLLSEMKEQSADDINSQIYGNVDAVVQRPVVPHVRTPTVHPGNMGGLPWSDAVAQQQVKSAQMNARAAAIADAAKKRAEKRSEIGIYDHYFTLDTLYAEDTSDPETGLFVFNITALNDNNPISDIIEMEIGIFSIPDIETETYQPEYFKYRKLHVDFENIRGQQYRHGPIGTTLAQTHFEFDLTTDVVDLPDRFRADPKRYSNYTFVMPVRCITELRVRFSVPHHKVRFSKNVLLSTTVTSAGPSPANRRIRTFDPHELTIGNSYDIVIDDFVSTLSSLNTFINSPIGIIVEVIDEYTLQFTTSPIVAEQLGSALSPAGGNPRFKVRIMDRRISMYMRFRSIVSRTTNFISP